MGDSVTVDDRAGGMQVNGFSRKRARHPNGCQVEKRQRYERAEKGYSSNPGSSKSSREKAQVREAYFGQVGRQLDGLLRYSAQGEQQQNVHDGFVESVEKRHQGSIDKWNRVDMRERLEALQDTERRQQQLASDLGNNPTCKWEEEEQGLKVVQEGGVIVRVDEGMYNIQEKLDDREQVLNDMQELNDQDSKAVPYLHLYNMLLECRSVDCFEKEKVVAEGAYGIVYRAKERSSAKILALKKVKFHPGERNGFPITSIREINLLLSLKHPNIVSVDEVVVGKTLNDVFMVMEWMDYDLRSFIDKYRQTYHARFSTPEVKQIMLQILSAVQYMHSEWVFHRDLKTSNILYDNKGTVKVCDFGLARQYASPLRECTPIVVTRWYRPPEVLFGQKDYSEKLDMWSLGCIMAELITGEALFPGKTDLDQIDQILSVMGTPTERDWPDMKNLPYVKQLNLKQYPCKLREKFPNQSILGQPWLTEQGFDLLCKMLTYDPQKRISSKEAMQHPWFMESPKPTPKVMMPTLPTPTNAGRGFMIK